MKIDPLTYVLETSQKPDKKFYFISGNEITLMERVKEKIIDTFKIEKNCNIEKIKNINSINQEVGLFNNIKLYIINETVKINNEILDNMILSDDFFLFIEENSTKNKTVKNLFSKRGDCMLFECYELSKESKSKILNKCISENNLQIEASAYWAILEKLENKYLFVEKELDKLRSFKGKSLDESKLEKIISKNFSGSEKIFFEVLKSNKILINLYNEKITSSSEVLDFYYVFKRFSMLIIDSNNVADFKTKIPRYLFREVNFLVDIFNKYNQEKKGGLINLLYKTEATLKKDSSLSLISGLRFLLNFRRLTIS
tara:strand:+ start:941 stop:1879 length:939 start_codon:yes stop_codon:yes gene_type:complete